MKKKNSKTKKFINLFYKLFRLMMISRKIRFTVVFVYLNTSLFFYLIYRNYGHSPNAEQISIKQERFPFKIVNENLSKRGKDPNKVANLSKSDEKPFDAKCIETFNLSITWKNFEKDPDFDFLKTEEGKEYKTILVYNSVYSNNLYFGFGHEPFKAACCKERRCFITNRRDKIPLDEFDSVLFHFLNLTKESLPKKRKSHQRWIFYENESPLYSSKNPGDYEGVFNWTMYYRKDSDIVTNYGPTCNKESFGIEDFRNFEGFSSPLSTVMKTKKKLVAWTVSNCHTPSNREDYVKELKKFIPVDIFGKCGSLTCGAKRMDKECYKYIEREYKFFLSFENSFCKDYITEKLFNTLSYHIVPVVRGGGDYAAMAPPHSYINVQDFNSPKDLADYLTYLDNNDSAYIEYFKWKKDYFVMNGLSFIHKAFDFCSLCQKLHNDKEKKIYYNLREWFVQKAECNKQFTKWDKLI